MNRQIIDRKYRQARIWSNDELKKMSHLFSGDICNVSAWRDQDKQGKAYKDYFANATSYLITNYEKTEARGFQEDLEDQIALDLEKDLDPSLEEKFDVIFNHTTLEHVYDFHKAMKNMCSMSRDIVLLIVPFLQETHADYGDYWRYTPQAMDKLFIQNGLETVYYSCNDQSRDSIYLFCAGSKNPSRWEALRSLEGNRTHLIYKEFIGTKVIKNSWLDNVRNRILSLLS